jgi:hypothetical protein
MTRSTWLALAFAAVACNGSSTEPTPPAGNAVATCSETAGATWSFEKSRFAFGGTPVWDGPGHWTSPHAAGSGGPDALAIPNADAPEQGRPDFSNDPEVLKQHVKEYLMGFGIGACQIADVSVLASFGGGGPVGGPYTTTSSHLSIVLARAIDGIPVDESHAGATMNDQDQSTHEEIFWPELPAEVVVAAKAFRDKLKDPAELAAYKSKLPTNYGPLPDGMIAIHHSLGFGNEALKFHFSYDVTQARSSGASVSFDADGKMIPPTTF